MVPIEIVQIQDGRTKTVADKVSMALAELVRKGRGERRRAPAGPGQA
jgi:hypothetical protein